MREQCSIGELTRQIENMDSKLDSILAMYSNDIVSPVVERGPKKLHKSPKPHFPMPEGRIKKTDQRGNCNTVSILEPEFYIDYQGTMTKLESNFGRELPGAGNGFFKCPGSKTASFSVKPDFDDLHYLEYSKVESREVFSELMTDKFEWHNRDSSYILFDGSRISSKPLNSSYGTPAARLALRTMLDQNLIYPVYGLHDHWVYLMKIYKLRLDYAA